MKNDTIFETFGIINNPNSTALQKAQAEMTFCTYSTGGMSGLKTAGVPPCSSRERASSNCRSRRSIMRGELAAVTACIRFTVEV